MLHVDNLPVVLKRGGMHAPNHVPDDGLTYHTIHSLEVQAKRRVRLIPCGPGGTVHDYVPFYFGPLSPMLLQLKTDQVPGYDEGQEPLLYLVSAAELIASSGAGFVFSDGHGIAAITSWFDSLDDLDKVDWNMVGEKYWADKPSDNDRQRRKQAEFLVHRFCGWNLIQVVAVLDAQMKKRVEKILSQFVGHQPRVEVRRELYY